MIDRRRQCKSCVMQNLMERKHGEYRWSQLFKRDEVQTGKRVLMAYGMQVSEMVETCMGQHRSDS